ncbi:hypothetical protein HDU79_006051 [Rhizoclosmatium sp. JEL0117]|nr:hypothetical protein HDU79_006051 [Rhizoclosmatium sp. JEL0117]
MFSPQQLTLIVVGSITIPFTVGVIACVAVTKRFHKVLHYMQVCLAVMHCYVTVMQGALIADSYWYYYHAYGWGFPILLTTIGFIVQYVQGIKVFGYTGTYCSGADKNMRLYIFYFELWAHIVLIIILYVMIFKKVVDILNKISGPPSSGQSGGHSSIATTSKNEAVSRKFLDSNKSTATASMNDSSVVASKASNLNVPVPAVVKAASIKTQQTSAMSNARVKAIVFRAILIAGGFIVIWTPPTIARVMQFLNIPVPDWLAIYMVMVLGVMTKVSTVSSAGVIQDQNNGAQIGVLHKASRMNDSRIRAILFRAVLIAGGFIVVWTPPTTGRLMQYFNITIPDWLELWMTVSFSMMGIWNAFVFFLTSYWNEIMGVLGLKKSGKSSMKESTNGAGTTGDASERV